MSVPHGVSETGERNLPELVQIFCRELTTIGGEAHVASGSAEAADIVAGHLCSWKASQVVVQGGLQDYLPEVLEVLAQKGVFARAWHQDVFSPQEIANFQAGVVVADWAIAATGSLVMVSTPEKGRSITLLPPAFVALVPESHLVEKRGEAFAAIHRQYADVAGQRAVWPSNITLVSGPSRTADIESDLSIGVHGPGKVVAIVVLNS